ncbi:MAG: hypothetical protein IPM39_09345 [Chloroflexi bacterium]|nr:hypothetical protein [Chloroflexota bacterium]
MHQFSSELTFVSDPGHGWLEVPLADIAALGLETKISAYSYINGRFAYLEEDEDYAVYMDALAARGLPRPEIRQRYVEYFDRGQPGFGDWQFSPEFWDKLRR